MLLYTSAWGSTVMIAIHRAAQSAGCGAGCSGCVVAPNPFVQTKSRYHILLAQPAPGTDGTVQALQPLSKQHELGTTETQRPNTRGAS